MHVEQLTLVINAVFIFIYLFIYFCLFAFSRAAPAAYGGSQARGLIGAIATSPARATATRDPSRVCDLHHSSRQPWILTERGQESNLHPHGYYLGLLTTEP